MENTKQKKDDLFAIIAEHFLLNYAGVNKEK